MPHSLTVVMPAYNEEKTVVASIGLAIKELQGLKDILFDYEIIVVNDGSNDKTAQLVSENYSDHPCIKLISREQNQGKGAAVAEGWNVPDVLTPSYKMPTWSTPPRITGGC